MEKTEAILMMLWLTSLNDEYGTKCKEQIKNAAIAMGWAEMEEKNERVDR